MASVHDNAFNKVQVIATIEKGPDGKFVTKIHNSEIGTIYSHSQHDYESVFSDDTSSTFSLNNPEKIWYSPPKHYTIIDAPVEQYNPKKRLRSEIPI